MKFLADTFKSIKDRLLREPVLMFGLIPLYLTAYQPQLIDSEAEVAFVAGATIFLQRIFSTSKVARDESIEVAKFLGAVEEKEKAAA